MRRIFTVFILLSFGLLQAQISITSTDFMGLIGHSNMFESDTTDTILNVNVGSAGANQTWDLSTVQIKAWNYMVDFLNPANTPYASNFSTANFVQKMTFVFGADTSHSYQYKNITTNQFISLGEVSTDPYYGASIDSSSNDVVALPLQYLQTWQSVTSDTNEYYQGFVVINRDSSNFLVDGWGTIHLASGTYQCLRLRENWYTISNTVISGQPTSSDTAFGISYIWLTKNNFMVASVTSLNGETNPNFTTASDFSRLASAVAIEPQHRGISVTGFNLEQNYPNPFNPATTIRFSLEKSMPVTLDIYSLNGRHIARLIDGTVTAGGHSITFNGQNLASGTYIYRIQAGSFVQTRKMLLIK